MATVQDMAIIKQWMNYPDEIVEESATTGCPLPEACTMLEQETGDARNVFGCDHGDVGDNPPYCQQPVTAARVKALRAHRLSNGVGPSQLTYDPFVGRADKYGGAHIPRYNIRVGFELLREYLDKYPPVEAFGAYNRGEANRADSIGRAYGEACLTKLEWWRSNLVGAATAPTFPEVDLVEGDGQYLVENGGVKWARVRAMPNRVFRSDGAGWLWVPRDQTFGNVRSWPAANDTPDPNSAWYSARCPTRYSWPGVRDDIDAWCWWLVDNYAVTVNTYHHHPESEWLEQSTSYEHESFDVWGLGGRGDPLNSTIGDNIFAVLLNDSNPPNIRWIIWKARIYGAWNNWQGEPFGSDPFSWHYDHIHVTYW